MIQRLCDDMLSTLGCSVLFFSCSRSEGWPHHGRTFSIYLCPLTFWLTFPRGILSTSWCCPSRPCVVFLACVHLALFLALSLSPAFTAVGLRCYTPHYSAFISRICVEIGMLWLFHILYSYAPIACSLFNVVRDSVVHSGVWRPICDREKNATGWMSNRARADPLRARLGPGEWRSRGPLQTASPMNKKSFVVTNKVSKERVQRSGSDRITARLSTKRRRTVEKN